MAREKICIPLLHRENELWDVSAFFYVIFSRRIAKTNNSRLEPRFAEG
jgi:hypothetical protein